MPRDIIFIASSLRSDKAVGLRSLYLIRALRMKGQKVSIITSEEGDENSTITYFRLASNKSSNFLRIFTEVIWGLELAIRLRNQNSESLIIYTLPPYVSYLVFRTFIKNRAFITDVRDLYPEALAESEILNYHSRLYKCLKRTTKKLMSMDMAVLAATKSISKELRLVGDTEQYVYYNGYPNLPQDIGMKFDQYTIVFHGTFGKFQNIELLKDLILATAGKPVRWILIGDGPKKALIENLESKKVSLYSRLSNSETLKIVSRCHLGISLRTDDLLSRAAIPVKVFEFIGLGINVVVTPVSEGGGLVEENRFGRQFDNDFKSILAFILDDSQSHQKINVEELSSQREKFSRDYLSEQCAIKILTKL